MDTGTTERLLFMIFEEAAALHIFFHNGFLSIASEELEFGSESCGIDQ
jgi:hypothetical protein